MMKHRAEEKIQAHSPSPLEVIAAFTLLCPLAPMPAPRSKVCRAFSWFHESSGLDLAQIEGKRKLRIDAGLADLDGSRCVTDAEEAG